MITGMSSLSEALANPSFNALVNQIKEDGQKEAEAIAHFNDPNYVPGSDDSENS